MTIKLCVPCRVIVFAPCLSMQESVAGGRQCVAVSLESLVESYQHGLGDVSSRHTSTVVVLGKLPVAVYHN